MNMEPPRVRADISHMQPKPLSPVPMLAAVLSGALTAKGNTLSARDTNSSGVDVLLERKRTVQGPPPLPGSVLLKRTERGFAITAKEGALDLSTLAASPATIRLGICTSTATDAVTVVKKGSKVSLK